MKKYQVSIRFEMDEKFMKAIPEHRAYINELIEAGTIDHYVVTMESQRSWITFSANSKSEVEEMLKKSPIYRYWTYEIEELYVVDGHQYRLPALQFN
ncbi:muconolactone Delta-isomerase family protein [Pollutibacter soli]|uniref:muconolactone Delta-isomerase family protein n=1 Tax=Pollutibacter soli TaxID=3034157 RepID=UPI003013CE36